MRESELIMPLPPTIWGRSRAAVTPLYAVMPMEGVLESYLPGFEQTTVRFLTAPVMGARFAQCILELHLGGGTAETSNDGLEHVFYLLDGAVELTIGVDAHLLEPHGFAYVPSGVPYGIRNAAGDESRLMWLKRPFEAIDLPAPEPIVGHRSQLEKRRDPHSGRYWQYLLGTGDLRFDMEVNILSFQPGDYFPCIETHIHEHGLYMLEGQMLYCLAGDWHEVEATDFIYMASYCPQFCTATGWGESAYLLYKDVNRDVKF
jgi:(S)-ureidoglycine aminohydrolase